MGDQGKSRAGGRQSEATAHQTRQRIVRSAREVFAGRGFEGVSLRDIAAQAAVTHGLLRHHFGSKEDIWRAVIDATVDEFLADLTPLFSDAASRQEPLATLKASARVVLGRAARHPDVARLLVHEGVEGGPRLDYFMERIAPIRAMMAPHFAAAQAEGRLAQFNHSTFLLFMLAMGALPLALVAFSNRLCDTDMLAPDEIERHIDRVIVTLFGET